MLNHLSVSHIIIFNAFFTYSEEHSNTFVLLISRSRQRDVIHTRDAPTLFNKKDSRLNISIADNFRTLTRKIYKKRKRSLSTPQKRLNFHLSSLLFFLSRANDDGTRV